MKKIIIALVFAITVLFAFAACASTSHLGHGGSGTSQHSGGCH